MSSSRIDELADGRLICVTRQPMVGGGWVATHQDITEQRRSEAKIAFMAHHDTLTGLANRTLLMDKIEEAGARQRRRGGGFAVFMLDLDRFKQVNDSLGHPAGDALLVETGRRLKSSLRETDVLARFGGDEFAIIQPGEANLREAAAVLAQRIINVITQPYDLDGSPVTIGTSIGIALAPEHGIEPGDLIKKADLALYRAKSEGRNGVRFFDDRMTEVADTRHQLENDLRDAISGDKLELHYQAIVDVKTCTPFGAEALARWRHPLKGFIPPDQFIPLAEETGLINALGEWVLRRACRDAATWPPYTKVAINLSAAQFKDGNLLEIILRALAETGLSPKRLELEITESVLLESETDPSSVIRQLKNIGVSIALDDFGTGYSSLSYLIKFAFARSRSINRSLKICQNGLSAQRSFHLSWPSQPASESRPRRRVSKPKSNSGSYGRRGLIRPKVICSADHAPHPSWTSNRMKSQLNSTRSASDWGSPWATFWLGRDRWHFHFYGKTPLAFVDGRERIYFGIVE